MDDQREIIIPHHYPVQGYKNKEKDYISLLLLLYLFQTGTWEEAISGPSCSKLTMSLVKDALKFTSSDTQICWNFLLKKCE